MALTGTTVSPTGTLEDLRSWARAHPQPATAISFPPQFDRLLVPKAALSQVGWARNLDVIRIPGKEIHIVVVERRAGRNTLDESDRQRLGKCYKEGELHRVISDSDKVIMNVEFKKNPTMGQNSVGISEFDGVTGKGIATDFYLNSLPPFLEALGYRYVVGAHVLTQRTRPNINFFVEKLGRIRTTELSEDVLSRIFTASNVEQYKSNRFTTVLFVDPKERESVLLT